MHELSVASAIVGVATERGGGAQVLEVVVEVGDLSGVVPEALEFAFEVAAAGTPCAGGRLVVERRPVRVHCPACDAVAELAEPLRFRCPSCGTPTGEVVGGRELHVVRLTLASHSDEEVVARATGG